MQKEVSQSWLPIRLQTASMARCLPTLQCSPAKLWGGDGVSSNIGFPLTTPSPSTVAVVAIASAQTRLIEDLQETIDHDAFPPRCGAGGSFLIHGRHDLCPHALLLRKPFPLKERWYESFDA